MRTSLLLISCCLALILIFNTPPIYSGDAKTGKEWSRWVFLDSYKIGSGDILEITTWKEPDFSRGEVLVRIDGKITFPLLGDIQASGRTPLQVKKDIETGLKDFVESPVVTVTVINPGSKKFYILGEVVNTGEYNLIKDLTVLQAFALAGGFTEWASKKEIILLRHEDGKEKIIRVNYKNIVQGKDFSQNIQIRANDTIIVP
jgi:polysaccharide export outer membrane protein